MTTNEVFNEDILYKTIKTIIEDGREERINALGVYKKLRLEYNYSSEFIKRYKQGLKQLIVKSAKAINEEDKESEDEESEEESSSDKEKSSDKEESSDEEESDDEIEMLDEDEDELLDSPINKALGLNLYRLGTIGDGSCLIHSILRSISIKYKDTKSTRTRKAEVKTVREDWSEKMNLDYLMKLGNGYTILMKTIFLLRRFIKVKFKAIKEIMQIYQIFSDRVEDMFSEIGIRVFEHMPEIFVDIAGIHSDMIKNNRDENETIIGNMIGKVHKMILGKYKRDIKNCSTYLGIDELEYIHQMLNIMMGGYIDIYFISSSTNNLPYNLGSDCNLLYKRENSLASIVIYYLNNNHFELITIKDDDGKSRATYFNHDHPLIECLYNYTCQGNMSCIFPE
jgi:hypothetical protein